MKFDSRLKEYYVWDSVRLDDPFTYYIVEWLDFLRQNSKDPNPRVWAVTRQSVADLKTPRDNEPYTEALACYSAGRCNGSFHSKRGVA